MTKGRTDSHRRLPSNRFGVLLIALVVLLASNPIVYQLEIESVRTSRLLLSIVFVFMLGSAVFAIAESRMRSWICVGLLAVAGTFDMTQTLTGSEAILPWSYGANAVALTALTYESLKVMFKTRVVTPDTISASICVYLLIAVLWAALYSLIDVLQPGSFQFNIDIESTPRMRFGESDAVYAMYYSLVTISTLGYGDIVPVTGVARMTAAAEAIVGPLYLAILVARLVALHIGAQMRQDG